MHRWGDLDDRQFPAPHLRWGHCALHTQWGYMLHEEVNTDSVRQTKTFFVLRCFSDFFFARTYSISCTAGEGFLILDCLYLQIGWWPFVCRWPTPEVTFNSWTKKCVVMLYGTASQPEEITNTVNATELHSWPVVRVSRQTARERPNTRYYTDSNHIWP